MSDTLDPYEAFEAWCKANGYADVIECEPQDVDLARMNAAIKEYGKT